MPKIADFGFQAFDLKPQRAACRKYQFHNSPRRRRLREGDVEEIKNLSFVPPTKAAARDFEYPSEMEARPAALAAARAVALRGVDPIEPCRDHCELL